MELDVREKSYGTLRNFLMCHMERNNYAWPYPPTANVAYAKHEDDEWRESDLRFSEPVLTPINVQNISLGTC